MTEDLDLSIVLDYVRSLRRHNRRDWFVAHRAQYDEAHLHFEAYVAAVIQVLASREPLGGVTPKDCIFRLNRDLRFSKDKTPYKPYMSAYIAPGGRKSRRLGTYLHIEAGDRSIIAGGLHDPEPHQLATWREAIDHDPRPFRKIANSPAFRRHFGAVRGERLKTAPKGYPKDHPDLDLLQLKQVLVWRELTDRQVASGDILKLTIETWKAMRPFLNYIQGLA
jgi:uncharacterized protein (TIGR02453 family)